MKLLGDFEADNAQFSDLDIVIGDVGRIQIQKLIGMGEINAKGADCKLVLQADGISAGYRTFVHAGGDHGTPEWGDPNGLYVGRSGWSVDATFSFEYTLTFIPGGQRINGFGASTFACANNRIIGYESHGYLSRQNPVARIRLAINAGLMRHRTKIYSL